MELKLLDPLEYEDSLPALCELFKASFGQEINPSYLRWRYLQNPINDLLVAVAIDEGKIIANYSVSPMLVEYENKTHKVALSMTTMTHPDYNGRGLFPTLANMIYSEMSERNYSFVFGFPNNNSHGIFSKKLNWEDVYETPNFSLILHEFNLDLPVDNEYTFNFHDTVESLVENPSYHGKISFVKDLNYYKWRYNENPINEYKNLIIKKNDVVFGNLIFKKFEEEIDIIELNGVNEESKKFMLLYLISKMKNQEFSQINSWINIADPIHLFMERMGFKNTGPVTYFGIRTFNTNVNIDNYKDWHFQMGDSDVY